MASDTLTAFYGDLNKENMLPVSSEAYDNSTIFKQI